MVRFSPILLNFYLPSILQTHQKMHVDEKTVAPYLKYEFTYSHVNGQQRPICIICRKFSKKETKKINENPDNGLK